MKYLITILAIVFSLTAIAETKTPRVIYGRDNRKDIYQVINPIQLNAFKSVAAQIEPANLKQRQDGKVDIIAETLSEYGMCSTERFANQTTAARCSGFLIGPDTLATAGHCVTKETDCSNYNWVFDYKIDGAQQSKVTVDSTAIYKCAKIIYTIVDTKTKNDFAIIKLDKVTDRKPLAVRSTGAPAVSQEIFVIGVPTGLPLKIADGAKIRKVGDIFLTANLDTYGGNSGSPVFNNAGEVEGILVRGDTDYVYNSQKGCYVSNIVADNGGSGEEVTLTKNFLKFITNP